MRGDIWILIFRWLLIFHWLLIFEGFAVEF
jgi:hypothetical protein